MSKTIFSEAAPNTCGSCYWYYTPPFSNCKNIRGKKIGDSGCSDWKAAKLRHMSRL